MTNTPDTIRVFIPLTLRRRNGRPRILPPANVETAEPRTQDPHMLRAIACACSVRKTSSAASSSWTDMGFVPWNTVGSIASYQRERRRSKRALRRNNLGRGETGYKRGRTGGGRKVPIRLRPETLQSRSST